MLKKVKFGQNPHFLFCKNVFQIYNFFTFTIRKAGFYYCTPTIFIPPPLSGTKIPFTS